MKTITQAHKEPMRVVLDHSFTAFAPADALARELREKDRLGAGPYPDPDKPGNWLVKELVEK